MQLVLVTVVMLNIAPAKALDFMLSNACPVHSAAPICCHVILISYSPAVVMYLTHGRA